jgi:antitoxin HicB
MRYPVNLEPDGKFLVVTFPDVPEAITQGKGKKDSLRHAADALESALAFYVESGRLIPMPSKPKRGQNAIELPASYAAKILLLNEMAVQKVRPAVLARRLHLTSQQVSRLLSLYRTSSIDRIAQAFDALGKSLEMRVMPDAEV